MKLILSVVFILDLPIGSCAKGKKPVVEQESIRIVFLEDYREKIFSGQ